MGLKKLASPPGGFVKCAFAEVVLSYEVILIDWSDDSRRARSRESSEYALELESLLRVQLLNNRDLMTCLNEFGKLDLKYVVGDLGQGHAVACSHLTGCLMITGERRESLKAIRTNPVEVFD